MDDEVMNSVQFTDDEMELIRQYQKEIEGATIETSILNAISLALDNADDCD